jgi:predicted N-acyltransferase
MEARLHHAIAEIPEAEWDALACPPGTPVNPFVTHAFLSALEKSGSATPETGWHPAHVTLGNSGKIVGAVPAYVKQHSYGEYVFDHGWAQAFERAGGNYYPKLQAAIPFTPATGPRLLTGGEASLMAGLGNALRLVCDRIGLSSVHVTFLPEAEALALQAQGFLLRNDRQFHWQNQAYRDFEDFLSRLSSSRRKNIRRERREALGAGIEVEHLTAGGLREEHWDAFFAFYMDTGNRKWGTPYLTRAFFSRVSDTMADRILLVLARRNGRYIAGALNFIGSDTLYGRNWGAIEHHPFLHFELCYYQAMEFAIARRLRVVEAGAQGEHKLARGYMPVRTWSSHWIAHPGLREAVGNFLEAERAHVSEEMELLKDEAPFRQSDTGDR